jgi:SagB-type dehydrogenase family enzyme
MSVAFGQLRGRILHSPDRAPLIRRTSPSGGARHPTEGYLVVAGVPGLADGSYHFGTLDYKLRRVPLAAAMPTQLRRGEATIVLTSYFWRNMYRYREPRTFRTVHMDVGHIVATLELAAAGLGLSATPVPARNLSGFDAMLGLDSMTEATLAVVQVSGRSEAR